MKPCGTYVTLVKMSILMWFIQYDHNFITSKELNHSSWWRHHMETFSALMTICAGNSPVPGEFPTQRPVTRSFDVYFDLLSKQSWGWWFETLSPPLWRHRNVFFTLLWIWPRSVRWRPVSCCRGSPSCRGWEEFVAGRSQGDYGEGRGGRVRLAGEQGTRQQSIRSPFYLWQSQWEKTLHL